MMLLKEPPTISVIRAAYLWNTHHNSDIAKSLGIKEPQALKLLDEARQRGMLT
jgi:DNA-binding transcriptional regulator LsrR (DeoR family)